MEEYGTARSNGGSYGPRHGSGGYATPAPNSDGYGTARTSSDGYGRPADGGYGAPGGGSGGYGAPGGSGYGNPGGGSGGYGTPGNSGGGYSTPGYGGSRTGEGFFGGGSGAGDSGSGGAGGSGGSGGDGSDGPHDPENGRSRRRPRSRWMAGRFIGPLAGAIGLVVLLGAGFYALADSKGGCSGSSIKLNVVAAPDIAPAVSDISNNFNKADHAVEGRCVQAVVKAADPALTTTELSGQGSAPGEVRPDVWVPDSSLWVTLVGSSPGGANAVRLTPTSLAESPILVATTRAYANKLKQQGIQPTWDMLLKATDALAAGAVTKNAMLPADSVHLQILDPTRNAAGLGTVVMTHMLLQSDPNATAIFTQMVRSVQDSISPDTKSLFGVFKHNFHGRTPIVIAPEQAVWKYNQTKPSTALSAIYPAEGMLKMDYPVATVTQDDTKLRAAQLLENDMSTANARADVRSLGFRTPDGLPGDGFTAANGVSPRMPRALPTPASTDVDDSVQAWTKLSLGIRMLTLLDISGSMNTPVSPGVTRMQATAQAAQGGLALLPASSDLGLWTFSTNLVGKQPYRVEVPLGALNSRVGSGTRREAVLNALGRIRPKPNGDTGLYDSVLAAVRSMQKSYRPDMYNSVLVLTDGYNDNKGGLTLKQLETTLKKEYNPDQPVMVIFIGLGTGVDMNSMQQIATQTDGAAYDAAQPSDIAKIFLATIARRLCSSSNCPAS
jgi:Bacterial extracellular solute-binding protein/von Willebrand factor type A domain